MKLSKTHYVILAVGVLALIAVWYFLFNNKKDGESSYDPNLLILGGPLSRTAPIPMRALNTKPIPGVAPFVLPGAPVYSQQGKVKYVGEITNKPKPCPAGSHQVTNADGSYGCVKNAA